MLNIHRNPLYLIRGLGYRFFYEILILLNEYLPSERNNSYIFSLLEEVSYQGNYDAANGNVELPWLFINAPYLREAWESGVVDFQGHQLEFAIMATDEGRRCAYEGISECPKFYQNDAMLMSCWKNGYDSERELKRNLACSRCNDVNVDLC
jgi:hypothetical protein